MTAYALHPQVGLRDERFGALAYHYGNRRLTFLNDPLLVDVVRTIGEYDDVDAALAARGVPTGSRPAYVAAIDRLTQAEVLVARD
ncbi:MAG: mycofactocin biosynthesis protein MftB [Frankiaceae bacterium]|nr:mycofactocin biosynthesis protein MftB [Frankiaceae bacterium]